MPFRDVRTLAAAERWAMADRVRVARDIPGLPRFLYFNYDPCNNHEVLTRGCNRCGIEFRRHQRVGIMWLYLAMRGLLADSVGPQPLDAKVLTPYGWASMGTLKPGDVVIDPDGAPSQVAEVLPQGEQDVYRVTFSDGTTAESTLEHLWQVRGETGSRLKYRTRVGREPRDVSPWVVRTLDQVRRRKRGVAVPLIRQAPDFAVPEADLPVDPYLLGLLLGDGALSKSTPVFVSADPELLEAAQRLRPEGWGWKLAGRHASCDQYRLGGSQSALRALGLFGHRAWEKFVPEIYKWTTASARLAVLQGLMDTDGNWASGSGAEFGSSSRQLATDVADLARSLGLRVSAVRAKKATYSYRGEKRQGRDCWRLTIAPAPGIELFRLPRKLKSQPGQRVRGDLANAGTRSHWQRDQRVKWIRKIEFSRRVPVQCIRVTAPSQLYVTDNWTVTHNTGKTAQVAGVLAMCKETGELDAHTGRRAVVVCRAAAVPQWADQLQRFTPTLRVVSATGTRDERVSKYLDPWDVLIISPQTLNPREIKRKSGGTSFAGDMEMVQEFDIGTVVYDDVDAMRHPQNRTAWAVKKLCETADRAIGIHGTPLQKRLPELWSFLEPLGGREIFGTEKQFRHRYIITETVYQWSAEDRTGRQVRKSAKKDVAIKNGDEFKRLVAPLVLRRTASDIVDVNLPTIQPNVVWLEPSPAQRSRYEQLRKGVLRKVRTDGDTVSQAQAGAAFMHGWQICSGLATLDEGESTDGSSVKIDWVMDKLIDGDLSDEKVVVFINFKPNVADLSRRLRAEGVGHVLMWGNESNPAERFARQTAFNEDPNCRILIGTTTIEQSLNLQAARHLIGVDTILNPARMEQLVGRIRRDGSAYGTVYFHQLLLRGTQEDFYLPQLEREQAMADYVWDERSEIFNALSPLQLMQMVAGQGA